MIEAGLADTSVFIAAETGRELDRAALPNQVFVSVVTIAELHLGVLAASTTAVRSQRLSTLQAISDLEPLPIDARVATRWADLRMRLADTGRRMNVNDLWIAAVASAHELPIITQDADFDVLTDIGGPSVIAV